jgi:hypothetical protein
MCGRIVLVRELLRTELEVVAELLIQLAVEGAAPEQGTEPMPEGVEE